ncbi:MAG: hypothetical protein MRERV_1c177 [Mycoplasmataceae bacterium RV_VA103A]|nr:MAG: hypothetical protein MRERV_1c177 [Mycoplasmataceae bacterium RV_VA103A]
MNKLSQVKNKQELEARLQILGRGIGPVRINEKGEIFVFDEKKTKKEYKIGQARRRIISGEEMKKFLEKTDKQEKES